MVLSIVRRRAIAGAYVFLIIVASFLIIFGQSFLGVNFPLVGHAISDPIVLGNEKPTDNPTQPSLEGGVETISLKKPTNSSNDVEVSEDKILSGRGSFSARGGGSGDSESFPFRGWRMLNLLSDVELRNKNLTFDMLSKYFQNLESFQAYKNGSKFADFDILFDKNKDLRQVLLDMSFEDRKILFEGGGLLNDPVLYVPRDSEHSQIRICSNVTSLEQVSEGCINEEGVIEERVIDLLDERLQISNDGNYFVISNFSGGIVSEFDSVSPIIDLMYPRRNAGDSDGIITFNFQTADATQIDLCSLYLDDELRGEFEVINNWETINLELNNLSEGPHWWRITCSDIYGNIAISDERKVIVIPTTNFGGMSTNLENVDLTNIINFTLENPQSGNIVFNENVDLSSGPDINSYVTIGNDFVTVESEMIPELNTSATIKLYNQSLKNPVILRDGEFCEECSVIENGDGITFEVEHFTTYVVTENSRLTIFDTTDSEVRFVDERIVFYANYTNTTSASPITGGTTCDVTFSDIGVQSMTYNSSSQMYEYNRTFSTTGTYEVFFDCDGSGAGFTELNGTDYASIILNQGSGPRGASVTEVRTESAQADSPDNSSAMAGNITELTLTGDSNTQSWQGYFGNASGAIELADSDGNALYNWTTLTPSGEVYATKAISFNFPTVTCANGTHISREEELIGQNTTDVDSVNNTFSLTSHPSFYVGGVSIAENSCRSTNLFNEGGVQSSEFYEVLLADGALEIAYVAILEDDATGFDGNTYDFEMIVGEDGHGTDTGTTTYYFFMELQ